MAAAHKVQISIQRKSFPVSETEFKTSIFLWYDTYTLFSLSPLGKISNRETEKKMPTTYMQMRKSACCVYNSA